MNKNECIDYCANKIIEMNEKYNNPGDAMKRHAVFVHCREVCEANGYTGMRFVGIWNKASKKAHGEED